MSQDGYETREIHFTDASGQYTHSKNVEVKTSTLESVEHLIGRDCNSFTPKVAEALMVALQHSHRTLQQTFWSEILRLANLYAEAIGTDGRNEEAKKLAKYISDYGKGLPCI